MLNLYSLEKVRDLNAQSTPDRRHLAEWRADRPSLGSRLARWSARFAHVRRPSPREEAATEAAVAAPPA